MSELRIPDPTLRGLAPFYEVWVDDHDPFSVPLAHRGHAEGGLVCREAFAGATSLFARDARWFAVPCRECFPDAPAPGKSRCPNRWCRERQQCDGIREPHLAWQMKP